MQVLIQKCKDYEIWKDQVISNKFEIKENFKSDNKKRSNS